MSFLFLSKLLPLFIYPLGLASLLLVIALILAWKHSVWVPLPIGLALAVLLLTSNGWVSDFLVSSLEWKHLPTEELPKAEAIVILGGATKSAEAPRVMPDINEQGDRIIYGAKLYQEQKAPLIIVAGGRIQWYGWEQPESADMAELLEMMGVPKEVIIQEKNSLNTYENAVNVKKILVEKGIKRILLVTSAMHMPRSLSIFQRQGIEAIPAPTDFLVSKNYLEKINNSGQSIILNAIPEAENLETTTKVIKEYIGTLIYRLRGWL